MLHIIIIYIVLELKNIATGIEKSHISTALLYMYLVMYSHSCGKTGCAACAFQLFVTTGCVSQPFVIYVSNSCSKAPCALQPFAISLNQIIMWKDWLCIPAIYEQVNIGYLCGKFGCMSQPFNMKQRYSCAKHI